jgi:hypothetical protein
MARSTAKFLSSFFGIYFPGYCRISLVGFVSSESLEVAHHEFLFG